MLTRAIIFLRTFVGAGRGTEPDITADSARDLWLLSDEFRFTALSTVVADWRAARPSPDSDTRLITTSLDERSRSQDRVLLLLDRKVDRLRQAAI
jgi:hypothetical protein